LWILDEPFAALDAGAIERVQSVAQAHLARGGMVVLTTHQDARIEAQSAADINLDRPSLIPSPSPQGEGESRASPLPSGEGRG
jgi:heme exporter protein A